jgi:hypothetical protein
MMRGVTEPRSSGRLDDRSRAAALGAILIGVGVLLVAANQLDLDLGRVGWPVFVIGPGIALLVMALFAGGSAGTGLAVAGGIVTMSGLVLAYQSATGYYASWAYAWALVGPTGVGVGLLVYGLLTRQPAVVRSAWPPLLIGLALFTAGFVFFEGVIGLGGDRIPGLDTALPAVAIGLGVVLVAASLLGGRGRSG